MSLAVILVVTGLAAAIQEPPTRPIGTLIFEDSFEREKLGKRWRVHARTFTIQDGMLVVEQQAGTKQSAVGETALEFGDASLQFSFKFEGDPKFSFMIKDRNHSGSPAGHICRLEIKPQMITLQDDKAGSVEEEESTGGSKGAGERIGETSVTVAADLTPGTWHTIILDIVGAVMKVRLDGEEIATLESAGIAHETKTDIGFSVADGAVQFDKIKAWKVGADKPKEPTNKNAR